MHIPEHLLPPPEPGLGIDPISIISVAGSIGDTLHFLQYPVDRQRKSQADQLVTRAAGGDALAEAQLRLLSGIGTAEDIAIMQAAGIDPGCTDPRQCGWATSWAKNYGKKLLVELTARRAAGVVGAELIGQSTIPTMIGAIGKQFATNPFVWIAGGALLYLVLRRRGRR